MKHERRLQRWMKELLAAKRLNPDNWLYVSNMPKELIIKHRNSGVLRKIKKVSI